MSESTPATATTEIAVPGGNCPWCFNDTLDALRAQPGVVSVTASMTGQCLRVEHAGADVQALLDTVHEHLHGAELASAEPVMVEVVPMVSEDLCRHHREADAGHRP